MPEPLFSELKGLKGGPNQAWINTHLDLIWELNNTMGFEQTREALSMKVDTLYSALQRAEKGHRPALTESRRALLKSQNTEAQLTEFLKEFQELKADYNRKIRAIAIASEWLERVFEMLKLALGGDTENFFSGTDIEARTDKLYVTSSQTNISPPFNLLTSGSGKQPLTRPGRKSKPRKPSSPGGVP